MHWHPDTPSPGELGGRPGAPGLVELAALLRRASWDVAARCVEQCLPLARHAGLQELGPVARVGNLPAFVGALAASLDRPHVPSAHGSNPILTRLAHDHVGQRERCGFGADEIMRELLVLRRAVWDLLRPAAERLTTAEVLDLEQRVNVLLDEVIAVCAVAHVDRTTHDLSERSRTDGLTGLLNHQAFHQRLDDELDRCRRYGHELQVIYFDLDDFKLVNDGHGHAAGDHVLTTVAHLVQETIRETDFAGRLGGDEFVVGLVESNGLAAHLLLDRLRARLARRAAAMEVPAGTAISAGCAGFPGEAQGAADLLALADQRQYADKRARKASKA